MAAETKVDNLEVEKRVVEGEEQYAIWVPITSAEGAALRKKAQAENINIRYLVANLLRGWMGSGGELSVGDLDAVVGGVAGIQTFSLTNMAQINMASQVKSIPNLSLGGSAASTVMCPW